MPWFKRADGVEFHVLDEYPDLITRLRGEGWVEIPASGALEPAAPSSAVPPAPVLTPAALEEAVPSTTPETTPKETPVKRVPARKTPIRATGKVPGRKPGTGKLSPQWRAAQWRKAGEA